MKKGKKIQSIHLIGVGGISMSALARYFLAQGMSVSGSDLTKSRITENLRKEGAKITIGHKKSAISRRLDQVIYNRAIDGDNPELIAARALDIRITPLAEAIGELTRDYVTIAITGSHGKSTTTALIGLILVRAGFDPTVFVGTELKEFKGKNIRIGKGRCFALEADDFDRAFLQYSPTFTVITNIDREHLDTYKNLAGVKKAFLQFIARTKTGGTAILNRDDKNLLPLRSKVNSIGRKNNLKIIWFSAQGAAAKKIQKVIQIPGAHNVSNAVAAYILARALNIPEKTILSAIGTYRGSWRRFEYRGEFLIKDQKSTAVQSVPVYDDYAHHPTEIAATLKGFKEKFPKENIICVFQPHQSMRLRLLFKEFVRAFDAADTVVITPIYNVPGRDEKVNPRFNPEALARKMQKKHSGKPIFYLKDFKYLKHALKTLATEPAVCGLQPNSPPQKLKPAVIVMMGAGDIAQYTTALIEP